MRFEDVLNVLFDRDAGDSYFRCVEKLLSLSKSVMVGDVPVPLPVEGNGVLLGVLVLDLPPSFMVKCLVDKDGVIWFSVDKYGKLFSVVLDDGLVRFSFDDFYYMASSSFLRSSEDVMVSRYRCLGESVTPLWAVGDSVLTLFRVGLGYMLLHRLSPIEGALSGFYDHVDRIVPLLQLDKLMIFYRVKKLDKVKTRRGFNQLSLTIENVFNRRILQLDLLVGKRILVSFISENSRLIDDLDRFPLETMINKISLRLLEKRFRVFRASSSDSLDRILRKIEYVLR